MGLFAALTATLGKLAEGAALGVAVSLASRRR